MVPRLALSSRNDPSRRSLKVIGCSGSGPVRADPALGSGGYGDGGYPAAPHPGGAPYPGGPPVAPGGGPHAGGWPPGGWPGGSQGGGGELLTTFLSSALARIVTRPPGPVNAVRDIGGKVNTPLLGRDVTSLAGRRAGKG